MRIERSVQARLAAKRGNERRFECRLRDTATQATSCRLSRRDPVGPDRSSPDPLLATGGLHMLLRRSGDDWRVAQQCCARFNRRQE